MFNSIFSTHTYLPSLGEGLLCPLNKPNGKPAFASNTRAISLLNSDRKIFSLVTLHRIKTKLESFISITQSGARTGRNTSDLVWTYRWLIATVQKYKLRYQLLGLDLSKAFDCVDRPMLLAALQSLLTDSEYRMVRLLLSDTKLQPRIKGVRGEWFSTTTGIPQGDSLSPILFTFYLELAFRHYKATHHITDHYGNMITHYVDDTDIIHRRPLTSSTLDLRNQTQDIKTCLATYNLLVNDDKTEYIDLTRHSAQDIPIKKLGNILSSELEIRARIRSADLAFGQLWKVWLNDRQISNKSKIRIYRACIEPILTYNAHCLALPQSKIRLLDVAHRRHLRSILRVFYPATIPNSLLYICAESEPISVTITQRRWQLFGHILRTPSNTPAIITMSQYYLLGQAKDDDNKKLHPCYKGSRPTSLPSLLNHDLQLIKHTHRLKTYKDFINIRSLASNRHAWIQHTTKIVTATRALVYSKIMENEPQYSPPIARTTVYSQSTPVTQDGGHRHRRYELGTEFPLTVEFDAMDISEGLYPHMESDIVPSTRKRRWNCLSTMIVMLACVVCLYTIYTIITCLVPVSA